MRGSSRRLEVELLEYPLGDVADDEHDGLPLEGDVEVVFALVDGGDDGFGDRFGVGELFALWHVGGHGGFGGAGLDGEDGDAFAVDAVAEAAEEGGEAGLRGAVEVVGLAAAVSGDGGDDGEGAGVALDAEVGEPGEERDRRHEVGVEDLGGGVEVLLGVGLVAEDAVGEVGDVHAGEGVDGVGEERGVLVGVVEVGDGGVDVAGAAGSEVGGYGGQFFGVAGDEEEAVRLARPRCGRWLRRCRRWLRGRGSCWGCRQWSVGAVVLICAVLSRSYESSVTRSQKLEVSSGSR